MKRNKLITSIIALAACMSVNAQEVRIYDTKVSTTQPVAVYTNSKTEDYQVVITKITTGEAYVSSSAGVPGNSAKWVQLWDGGPKWATFNVGAKSASEYGGYYYWGNSTNKATNDSHSTSREDIQYTSDDTAKKLWGEDWMLPTQTDYANLIANCTATWTTQNGLNGVLFTGKGTYSYNSVFFPAAGLSENGELSSQQNSGMYATSTPIGDYAYFLFFSSEQKHLEPYVRDFAGCSVRAILHE